MRLLDARRLTGPGLLLDRPGAVVDVTLSPAEAAAAVAAWSDRARRLLAGVGWGGEAVRARLWPGGASLALTAPLDLLYTAVDLAETAWLATAAAAAGEPEPDLEAAAARLVADIAGERNPALVALAAAAAERGVACLVGEGVASVGLGAGSLAWPVDDLPEPVAVPWHRVHDVPVLLVTGTNGKTTTVRLAAAVLAAAGRVAGFTSTEGVQVGAEILERGDFSGPGGARALLRDRRVEAAVLEVARGGLLRRGLPVGAAEGAAVTNIAADHLGEYGIGDVAGLADAKLAVTRVVRPAGRVVLNGGDPLLAARGATAGRFPAPVIWFASDPASPLVRAHLAAGGEAWLAEDGELVRCRGRRREAVARIADLPVAWGGAARHNVENALAAAALAATVEPSAATIAAGLATVGAGRDGNPGRGTVLALGGATLLLDYAHNPHGLAALLGFAATLPAARRLILLGQAGDRDDAAVRELARTAWSFRPDHVVVKELPSMLRGRRPGEVPAILANELRRLGAPESALETAGSDPEAVRRALAWARPGDLLVLLVHTERDAVLDLLDRLEAGGWRTGEPLTPPKRAISKKPPPSPGA